MKNESMATISCNGTKLLICFNTNGNKKINVEAETRTRKTNRQFLLTQISRRNGIIASRMIQKMLRETPELVSICEKSFFPQTTIAFNNQ